MRSASVSLHWPSSCSDTLAKEHGIGYSIKRRSGSPARGEACDICHTLRRAAGKSKAYVHANPGKFGLSANQLEKGGGLFWGAVKKYEGQVLTRLASKAVMLLIVMQLRDKWNGNSPAKNAFGETIQEPKGKETLMQLSSLFLWLEQGAEGVPAANVLKSRIAYKAYVADPANPPPGVTGKALEELKGEPGVATVQVLPLRLPKATWAAIRQYMKQPANLLDPAPGERPTEKQMNDDDRLRLRAIIASSESEVAAAQVQQHAADEAKRLQSGKARLISEVKSKYPDANAVKAALEKLGLTYSITAHDDIRSKLMAPQT